MYLRLVAKKKTDIDETILYLVINYMTWVHICLFLNLNLKPGQFL